MEEDNSKALKNRLFYGWVVGWAGFALSFAGIGSRYCFGVFLKSLEGGFDISRASASGIFSLYMMLCVLVSIGGGWALDRFGPRKIGQWMGVFTGASLILTSMTTAAWQLLITYSLLLALGTGAIYGMANTTTSRWFVRKRGFVIGITSSGGGVGAIVLAPLAAYLISHTGWRSAFLATGILVWLIIAVGSLLLKKDPSVMGLLPDGDTVRRAGAPAPPAPHPTVEAGGLTLRQCIGTSQFWLLVLAWLSFSLSLHMILIHIVPYALDLGVSALDASLTLSIMGITNIAGRLGFGRLSDRVGRKSLGIVCPVLHFVTMLWLLFSHRLWMLYGFAVFFGMLWGGSGAVITTMIGDLFGTVVLGRLMGLALSAWALGAAVGPAVGGAIFDVTGSYTAAFGLGAVSLLATAAAIALIRPVSNKTIFPPSPRSA